MPQILSLVVSGAVLALLAVPPAFALRMLFRRLGTLPTERRMPYQALIALTGLVLIFNLLVWAGMPAALRGFLPDAIDRNLGYVGLLLSWGAAGLCVMLAVLHPRPNRQRSSV